MNRAHQNRNRVRIRLCANALAAALLALVAASSARAAFPGANGPIAYVSDRDSPPGGPINDEIYVQNANPLAPAVRLTNDPALDEFPAVSPNGKEIAFTSTRNSTSNPNPEGDAELYVMDINDDNGDGNGDNLRRLTNDSVTESGPAWSPDGKTLAFTSNGDIYAMPADGSEPPTDLTPGTTSTEAQPRFSPDGTKIAFITNRDGNFNVYWMNPDGSGLQQITSNPALDSHPDFSPDGTQLTFASNRGGNLDIYTMKAAPESAANVAIDVTPNLATTNERFPVWSPDGTKIVFWSGIGAGTGTDSEIYVMNTDGSDQTNITHNTAGETTPDWGRAPTHKHRSHTRARRRR